MQKNDYSNYIMDDYLISFFSLLVDVLTDDSDTGSRSNSKERKGRKSRRSKIPSYRKSTTASRAHKESHKTQDSG